VPSLNKLTLMGNVVRNISEPTMVNKLSTGHLTMALNYKDKAVFVDVALWGSQADNAFKFLQKGSLILVEGRLTQDKKGLGVTAIAVTYLSKKDGCDKETVGEVDGNLPY